MRWTPIRDSPRDPKVIATESDTAPGDSHADVLLAVRDLAVEYSIDAHWRAAVTSAEFELRRGRTLAIVGESGCGKSATCLALTRLLPTNGRIASGEVFLDGVDLLKLAERNMERIRGRQIGMVFQDALTALDPLFTVGDQLVETIRTLSDSSRAQARRRAAELLELVGIPDPVRRLDQHPHTMSGGMRQRVMIALALAGEPDLLIADEPTTSLDVTTQRQILDLIRDLQERLGMAVLIVAHDLAVVADIADDVAVMYAGRVVERGPTSVALKAPKHPYTDRLLASVIETSTPKGVPLPTIPGSVPDLGADWGGCEFRSRCHLATRECGANPPLSEVAKRHLVACFHSDQVTRRA